MRNQKFSVMKFTSSGGVFLIISVAMFLFALMIGPMDFFAHGYYCDDIDMSMASQNASEPLNLMEEEVKVRFEPVMNHFAGFEIYMEGVNVDDVGTLHYSIEDDSGKVIEQSSILLSSIGINKWYKVYTKANCKTGSEYLLRFYAEGSNGSPSLASVDTRYLGSDVIGGNTAIVFAYKKPTFDAATKAFFIIFLLAAWFFLAGKIFFKKDATKSAAMQVAMFIFLIAVLAWNYTFNTLDSANTRFSSFPSISDDLVTSAIFAEEDGREFEKHGGLKYGLMDYETVAGRQYPFILDPFLSDENWDEGYSKTDADILLPLCTYTKNVLKEANYVQFASGDRIPIKNYDWNGTYIQVHLNASTSLIPEKYGRLDDIRFIREDGTILESGWINYYTSQYGLQGKVYQFASGLLGGGKRSISILFLLSALATASVLVLLVVLLYNKYGLMYAGVSYIVFLLSPWVVNFARSLYWVEFTWFIPMIIGLYCSMQASNRRRCLACYIAAYLSITLKCLCGYEYVSSVMLGLISFPLVDFVIVIIERNKKEIRTFFQMNLSLGLSAMLGFFSAVCLHAVLRGDGNVVNGIVGIIQRDLLRRTSGGNLNDYEVAVWDSLNASHWETICKYFHFDTEIIAGITGNLFPLLCCIPIIIFTFDAVIGKLDKRLPVLYGVFFCVATSWFVLAKAHSYIHVSLNYAMWYLGFVQVCFYVIARWIYRSFCGNKNLGALIKKNIKI